MASEQFDVAVHFGENLAAKYHRRIRRFCPSYDALHQMIAPWLQGQPENARFLSAGAGVGAEIITLAERFPFWRFAAVDVSPDMINACRHRLAEAGMTDRVDFFNGRLQDYRSPAPFHAASSIFVAHFIKGRTEKLDYFHAMAKNLEPGGLLVVADLFGDRNSPEFVRLSNAWLLSYASHGVSAEELAQDRAHVERDVDFIPESELLSILKDAGFETPLRFYQTYLFGGWVAAKSK
ncbi:methyltransferase domain-containing protein [Methylocystis heyeri]|uniref:Methyltransferase domain-containing protein n=2 Tax=Methylocystis heyeri TaxID=391905 RepID=A0A6B8KMH7_9HYPH|nr:methyltransferase domain-containing protein [Methylocystis heyeri]